jgi:hypothetical protein
VRLLPLFSDEQRFLALTATATELPGNWILLYPSSTTAMPTYLLIGEDTYSIQQKLAVFKSKLDSIWLAFNFHIYGPQYSGQNQAAMMP